MIDGQPMNIPAPSSLQDQARMESQRFGTDMVRMIETILEDKLATEKIKANAINDIWIPNQKSLKLTFFDQVDAQILGLQFEEAKLLYLVGKRRSEIDTSKVLALNQLSQLNRANIKRSVGSTGENMNERKLQATSISYSSGTFREGSTGRGLGGRLAGLFGRKVN